VTREVTQKKKRQCERAAGSARRRSGMLLVFDIPPLSVQPLSHTHRHTHTHTHTMCTVIFFPSSFPSPSSCILCATWFTLAGARCLLQNTTSSRRSRLFSQTKEISPFPSLSHDNTFNSTLLSTQGLHRGDRACPLI